MTTKKQLQRIGRTLSYDLCEAVVDAKVTVANNKGEIAVYATIFDNKNNNATMNFYHFLELADNIKNMNFCRKLLKDEKLALKFIKGEING